MAFPGLSRIPDQKKTGLMNSKPLRIVFALLLIAAFFAAVWHRHNDELNCVQLHVRLAEDWKPHVAGVLVRLPDNSLRSLRSREEDRNVYSMLDIVSPATSVVICTNKDFQPGDVPPEIRCGENWVPPYRKLAVSKLPRKLLTNQSTSEEDLVWWEFVPEPYSRSRRLAAPGVVNWQGDHWLIGVPFLQTLVFSLLLVSGCFLLRSAGLPEPGGLHNYQAVNLRATPVFSVGMGCVRCILILLTLHQLAEFWPLLWDVRWGGQFLAAWLGLLILLSGILFYIREIRRASSDRRRMLIAGTFLLVSLILKLIWVSRIDSVQTGDYEKYWRYGQAIAANDAGLVGDEHWPTRILYLQRAWAFTSPIVQLFGSDFSAVEVSCVVLQLLTALICGWLIQRMFTLQAACCALPFLIFYPAFWYSPTLAAINNAGFLSMVALWCLVQLSMTFLGSLYGRMLRVDDYLKWGGLTLLLSGFWALVDLQKSFGIFVILTTVISGSYAVLRYLKLPDEQRPQKFFRTVFLAVAMLYFSWHCSRMIQRVANADLVRMNGPLPSVSMIQYLSSVDSTTNGDGRTLDNWRFAYVPMVPAAQRERLLIRKILHEKVAAGIELWLCAFRKNAFMTLQTDYKNRTFGGYSKGVEGRWEFTRVPWNSAQNWMLQGFYSFMLLLALKRLLSSNLMPIATSELFPLVFVTGQYLVILFAMEAGPYYSHILGFPLAWSAGLVMCQKSTEARSLQSLGAELMSLIPGALTMTIIVAWHLVAGMAVDRSELSFLKLKSGEATQSSVNAVVEESRVHQALTFPADLKELRAGDAVSTTVVIPAAFARGPELCFFLSVNARARNLYRKNTFWDELPVEYELAAGEKVIRSGRMGDLHPPMLIQVSKSDFALQGDGQSSSGSLPALKLTLKVLKDLSISKTGIMPALAVEYAFNPLEASGSKASPTGTTPR